MNKKLIVPLTILLLVVVGIGIYDFSHQSEEEAWDEMWKELEEERRGTTYLIDINVWVKLPEEYVSRTLYNGAIFGKGEIVEFWTANLPEGESLLPDIEKNYDDAVLDEFVTDNKDFHVYKITIKDSPVYYVEGRHGNFEIFPSISPTSHESIRLFVDSMYYKN